MASVTAAAKPCLAMIVPARCGRMRPGRTPGVVGFFDLSWAASLQAECREARVPYFLKQLGQHITDGGQRVTMQDGHGGKWLEWPEELRVRQMPIFVENPPEDADVRRRDVDVSENLFWASGPVKIVGSLD